jgi:hypothetical protein
VECRTKASLDRSFIPTEERVLEDAFGDARVRYESSVRRWI